MNRVLPNARENARENPAAWLVLAWFILLVGAALRFWKLGDFPFHPDEAIHAWFALDLRHYHYDPIYHGPLMYHLVASAFVLFGITDFAARLVPAACGVLLLWLVLFPARAFLSTRACLWSGVLLALSPVIVAYSRRLLHDSLVLALTFGAVLCFQASLENASTSPTGRNARVGLAAILTLFLATKANVFFIVAMLFAFWIWHLLSHLPSRENREKLTFDFSTLAICALTIFVIFALLYRRDSLSALPAMIGYWGGQQGEPRLPGPHDYYLRLLLIYELPLFLAAIWGAFCALKNRTLFTDLVLWWALTSLVLYAVANEKVPWLMAHQVLPLALLGGYGMAQLEWKTLVRKLVLGAAILAGLLFSSRHLVATNWDRAANHHEPLFFAQTTEAYRDTLFSLLRKTRYIKARDVWAAPSEQWPVAWYLRDKSSLLEGSEMRWDENAPDASILRLLILPQEQWDKLLANGKFVGWNYLVVERYVWPRPAWSALKPAVFWKFWRHRESSLSNGVLEEESAATSVFAAPPDAKIDKDFLPDP